jgi:hypothetical protein
MKDKHNHIKSNIKIENLPKKQLYTVPDNYFNELPGIVQARAVKQEKERSLSIFWSASLRYALPVIALVMMLVYFGVRINNEDLDVQAMLDDIPTEELILYITESEITTEELLSLIDINELDVEGLANDNIEILNDSEWEDIIEAYPELENDI